MKRIAAFSILLLIPASAVQAATPLLPQPKEVRFGSGRLALEKVKVCMESSPAAEDRFAATELASYLSSRLGRHIEVAVCDGGRGAIVLRRTGAIDSLPGLDEKSGPGSREAYELRVDSSGGEIKSASSAGVFYGVQTMKQLVTGDGDSAALAAAEIKDWPETPYRGFMMDMSHTQLPRVEEIKQQIDFLARWKTNLYLFYSEASIELDGYPLLMERGRYSKEEVREIVAYARERHMEVAPNLELYGHIHDLLRLERYADMAVLPHGGEFNRSDPRVFRVIEDMISQVADLFPGPFFHIGFDETWIIEVEAERLGKPAHQLYLEQLKIVDDMVRANGKTTMFFADMMQKFPQAIPEMQKGMVAVAWHYYPKPAEEYADLLDPFREHGTPLMVQGAVMNWTHLVPFNPTAYDNTDLLLKEGRKRSATGYLMSGWTDDSVVLTRLERPVIAHSMASAWQQEKIDRERFYSDYASILYPAEVAPDVAKAWAALDRAEGGMTRVFGENTIGPLWDNPFLPDRMKTAMEDRATLREARLAAEDAQEAVLAALKAGHDTDTLRAMLTGARLVDYAALRYLYVADTIEIWERLGEKPKAKDVFSLVFFELGYKYHTKTADLMDAITELKEQQRNAWLVEFTPFRLGTAMGKFDAEFQSWWRLQRRLEKIARGFEDGDTLPSLDTLMELF